MRNIPAKLGHSFLHQKHAAYDTRATKQNKPFNPGFVKKSSPYLSLNREKYFNIAKMSAVMKAVAAIKRTAFFVLALISPLISIQLFPVQAKVLMQQLQTSVGPTMPFLILFSFYTFAGLQLAFKKPKDNHDITSILDHTERIAALIIPLGMIGTYYALVQVLSSKSVDFSAHMHALNSTLIALITYVVILIGSEFITRIRNASAETLETENIPETTSKNTLTIQQIEMTGFLMGICLFLYLSLATSGIFPS